MKFKLLPSTNNKIIEFQAFGKDINEAFVNSALALTNVICKQPIKARKNRKMKIYGKDSKHLLYDFLEGILTLSEVHGFLISDVKSLSILGMGSNLRKRKYELVAEFEGDDIENYSTKIEVQSINHRDLSIEQERVEGKTVFVCKVVVDV